MKVCIISNYLPDYHNIWGGAERAALLLIEGLKNKKIDVAVITNDTNIKKTNLNIFFIKQDNKISKKILNRLFNFSYYNPLLTDRIDALLDDIKPDLLHLQNFSTFSTTIIKQAKRKKIPVVFSIYDYWAFCPNGLLMYKFKHNCHYFHGLKCKNCFKYVPYGRCSYFNALERVLFKKYLNHIDRFIVLSRNSFEILFKYGIDKNKLRIIPLPLYEEVKTDNHFENGLILFVGWISYNKGLHILIEAVSKIIKDLPFISVYVAETGAVESYKQYIFNLIDRLSLNPKIKFLGKLSHQEINNLLRLAHIVVIPEQWQNPLPLILAEAINFKRPIVASKIGGIPEILKQERFLAQYNSPEDFADKISWIIKNTPEAFNYAEDLNQEVSQILSVNNNLDRIIKLYYEVLKG